MQLSYPGRKYARVGALDMWIVYIIETERGTLYTGCTTDLVRRLFQHNTGKGARYFRLGGPGRVRYAEACPDRSGALKRESAIKKMTRSAKLDLIHSSRTQTRTLLQQVQQTTQ